MSDERELILKYWKEKGYALGAVKAIEDYSSGLRQKIAELEAASNTINIDGYIVDKNTVLRYRGLIDELQYREAELEDQLKLLRESKGLLPVCKVDQELFAANATCAQQAKMIEYLQAAQKGKVMVDVEVYEITASIIKSLLDSPAAFSCSSRMKLNKFLAAKEATK